MTEAPTPLPTPDGPPSGVVLDLGNVLVQWSPREAVAAGVGAAEADAYLAAVDFHAFNHGPDAGMTWDDALAEVARRTPQWLPHATAYRDHFAHSLVAEVPGTADVVSDLRAAGVPVWGLTNWSHELWPHGPRRFPVLGRLDGVVVSGTEGVAKPDPRAYLLVAERMGLPPGRLVFADDRADNVAAARDVGMRAVLFTDAARLRADLRALGLPV